MSIPTVYNAAKRLDLSLKAKEPSLELAGAEIDYLKKNVDLASWKELASRLNVSLYRLSTAAARLGISRNRQRSRLSPDAFTFMRENAGVMSMATIGSRLGISRVAVLYYLRRLGSPKSKVEIPVNTQPVPAMDAEQVLSYVKENAAVLTESEMAAYLHCHEDDIRLLFRILGMEEKARLAPDSSNPVAERVPNHPGRHKDLDTLVFLRENAGSLSIRAMADALGYSSSYIYQLLRNAQIPASVARSRSRQEKTAYIRQQYGKMPALEICRSLGVSYATFLRIVGQEGLNQLPPQIRKPKRPIIWFSPADAKHPAPCVPASRKRLRYLLKNAQGRPQKVLAARLGISQSTVSLLMRHLQIPAMVRALDEQEHAFIRDNLGNMSQKEIAARLGRSATVVASTVQQLGMHRPGMRLNASQIAVIKENAGVKTNAEIAAMIHCSAASVSRCMAKLSAGKDKGRGVYLRPEELDFLRENIGKMSHAQLAAHLGRAHSTVKKAIGRYQLR